MPIEMRERVTKYRKYKPTGTSASGFEPDWIPAFKKEIHGVVLVTGDCQGSVHRQLAEIKKVFKIDTPAASIHSLIEIDGVVRP